MKNMSLKQIGKELGGVSVSAISQNMKRLSLAMKKDPELRERFNKLTTIMEDFGGIA